MGTKVNSNYEDLLTFTRASKGHALRPVSYGPELVSSSDQNQSDTTTDAIAKIEIDPISVEVGKIYFVSATVTATSTGTYRNADWGVGEPNISPGNASTFNLLNEQDAYENGVETNVYGTVIPNQNTIGVAFRVGGTNSGNNTFTVSNISVKEVLFDQPDGTLTLFEHPNNVPRVEYDADRNRLGLLVEESRTNLITDSAGASSDDATSGSSQTSGQANSLTGLDDAFLVQATNTGTSYRGQRISVTSGTSYAASRFIKAGTTNFAQISMGTDGFGTNVYANFDLSNGTVATESNCDASITEMGGGWYRCSITKAATNTTSGTSPNYFTPVASGTSTIRTATSGDNVYQFGAQIETGSFPTSYIKTTGSTATRSADVASIPVADFGFNTKVGSVVAEYLPTKVDSQIRSVFELAKDSDDRLYSSSSNDRHWFVKSGGTIQANIDLGISTEGQLNKIAGAYKQNDFAASLDGGSVTTDTSGAVQTGTTDLHIGGIKNNADNYLNGHIKSIKYYPRRLTDAQLQALTEPRSDATLSLTFDGLESSFTENYIHG